MSNDKHTIRVSLDTSANPPVSVDQWDLELKHKGTHKVVWKPADDAVEFVFHSLEIGGQTFSNPTSGGSPGNNSPLSDIDVADKKTTLKDKVDGVIDFPYVLEVRVGDEIYSTVEVTPKTDGRSPGIRNEA
jgi:hypothetical protein